MPIPALRRRSLPTGLAALVLTAALALPAAAPGAGVTAQPAVGGAAAASTSVPATLRVQPPALRDCRHIRALAAGARHVRCRIVMAHCAALAPAARCGSPGALPRAIVASARVRA